MAYSTRLFRPFFHVSPTPPTLHFPTAIKTNHSSLYISNQTLKSANLSTSSQSIQPFFNPLRSPQSNPSKAYPMATNCSPLSQPSSMYLFGPVVPLLGFYKLIPLASLVSFYALYIDVVRDRKRFSRYVKLNALQSLMLEFIAVLPSLLHIFLEFGEGLGIRLVKTTKSAIFLVILACFVYSLVFCVFGKTLYFPIVTNAIDWCLSLDDQFF